MNNFTIQTEGNRCSLVYAIQPGEAIDTFSLGMLTENNRIPGIVETSFSQLDAQKYLIYNITARITARQLLTGPVNKQRILNVFEGITSALKSAEDYMLPFNSLMLDLDLIYCDLLSSETVLICLPLTNIPNQNDPCFFMKSVLVNTQFDQAENCDYVTALINYLNAHPTLPLEDFRKLLLDLRRDTRATQPIATISSKPANSQKEQPQKNLQAVKEPIQSEVSRIPPHQSSQPQTSNGAQEANRLSQPSNGIQCPYPQPQPQPQPSNRIQQPIPQPQSPVKAQNAVSEGEKPMSLFYLLQHYSKENKAIYDAQHQAAAKEPKQTKQAAKKDKPQKSKKGKKENKGDDPFHRDFYIPGQQPQESSEVQWSSQKPQQADSPQERPIQQATPQQSSQLPIQSNQVQNPVQHKNGGDFGDTDYFPDGDNTLTKLMDSSGENGSRTGPYLLRIRNNERIPLDKPVFRIGREAQESLSPNSSNPKNDYVVSDNPYVGGCHAVIMSRNGEYYLIDCNAKNHSFVNGEQIPSGVEARLTHGTRFSLANEEFEFRLF